MSENIYPTDPIFFLPIDFGENSKNYNKEKKKLGKKEDIIKNHYKLQNFINFQENNRKPTEDQTTSCYSSSGKDYEEEIVAGNKIIEKNSNNNNDKAKTIIFSKIINDKSIKSMTNSSKIYVSEILKSNWKLKSRRLITKLKKRLIKEYNKSCKINLNPKDKIPNLIAQKKCDKTFVNANLNLKNINNNNYIGFKNTNTNNFIDNINSLRNRNYIYRDLNYCNNYPSKNNININQYKYNYQLININGILNKNGY